MSYPIQTIIAKDTVFQMVSAHIQKIRMFNTYWHELFVEKLRTTINQAFCKNADVKFKQFIRLYHDNADSESQNCLYLASENAYISGDFSFYTKSEDE